MKQPHPNNLDAPVGELNDTEAARISRLIRGVVQAEFYRRRSISPEDVAEVCSDAMSVSLAPTTDTEAPEIASRACSAWSRSRYADFHCLRIRLRYLLKVMPQFDLWQDKQGNWICGHTAWRTTLPVRVAGTTIFNTINPTAEAPLAVLEIFDRAIQPLYFNDLARVCAGLWAIEDTPNNIVSGSAPEIDTASQKALSHLSEEEIATAAAAGTALARSLQAHLASCTECQREVFGAKALASAIKLEKPIKQTRRSSPATLLVGGALAVVAAIAFVVLLRHPIRNYVRQHKRIAAQLDAIRPHGLSPKPFFKRLYARFHPAPEQVQIFTQLEDSGTMIELTTDGRLIGISGLTAHDESLLIEILTTHQFRGPSTAQTPQSSENSIDTDPATLAQIANAQRQSHSHLLLAALYASNGMTGLARAQLDILQQENPDLTLMRELRRSLPSQ